MSPAYAPSTASLPITQVRRGDLPVPVWNNENPLTGTKSQAVNIQVSGGVNDAAGGSYVSIRGTFSAAPGAFTIQVQTADQDVDAAYVSENFGGATPGTITTVNANNSFSVELIPIAARFIRLLMVLQNANAVNLTATISRG
jgi:hypothetical protein